MKSLKWYNHSDLHSYFGTPDNSKSYSVDVSDTLKEEFCLTSKIKNHIITTRLS